MCLFIQKVNCGLRSAAPPMAALLALLLCAGCAGQAAASAAQPVSAPQSVSSAPASTSAPAEPTGQSSAEIAESSSAPPQAPAQAASSQTEAASSQAEPASSQTEPASSQAESAPSQAEPTSGQTEPASSVVTPPLTSAVEPPAAPAQRPTKLTVRLPSASGKSTKSSGSAAIDYSNSSQGYIMVKYTGSNSKVKLQMTGPNKLTYTYTLHKGGYVAFPLTGGSGSYQANVYENISGSSYALALECSFSAKLASSLLPYLYPSQYVNYGSESKAVAKGEALAAGCATKIGVVQAVYNYLIANVTYDSYKASTVVSGYTPNVDSTLATGKGICFDYAALMASMLRTQDIPTRMEVGYVSGSIYHAWVSVYLPEKGWVNGIIQFDGANWRMMDPTFAAGSPAPKSYTTSSYTYSVKYLY